MVELSYIRAACASADTVMGWAFRRALGIRPIFKAKQRKAKAKRPSSRYRGVRECVRNERGVDPDAGRW